MNHRVNYIALTSYDNKIVDGKKVCLNCDNFVIKPFRRYCSKECSHDFFVKNSHTALRYKLAKECNHECKHCGIKITDSTYVLDHVIPIACGGEEFNESNLQILCSECNKIKTKKDMADIASCRFKERMLSNNKNLLDLLKLVESGTNE
jgi:5-methylcytosine-specific restriction endonuclease McrA